MEDLHIQMICRRYLGEYEEPIIFKIGTGIKEQDPFPVSNKIFNNSTREQYFYNLSSTKSPSICSGHVLLCLSSSNKDKSQKRTSHENSKDYQHDLFLAQLTLVPLVSGMYLVPTCNVSFLIKADSRLGSIVLFFLLPTIS